MGSHCVSSLSESRAIQSRVLSVLAISWDEEKRRSYGTESGQGATKALQYEQYPKSQGLRGQVARVDLKDPCENSAFLRERNLGLLKMRKLSDWRTNCREGGGGQPGCRKLNIETGSWLVRQIDAKARATSKMEQNRTGEAGHSPGIYA